MERWIKTYPKIFSKEECAGLIEWFEILDENNQLIQTKLEGHREFDEVNLNDFREQTLKMQLDVYKRFDDILERYKQDVKVHKKALPEKSAWEELRIKRYRSGVGNFLDHVDVGDYISARRFLVFFVYLNNVEEGGETEFPTLDLQVSPERGTILVFPSTWTFLHRGNVPISNDKYILGSYKHYVCIQINKNSKIFNGCA